MRVKFTHYFTDYPRALDIRAVPDVVHFMHGKQYAAMYGLQAVAHIGQRTSDDHAHRVIEITFAHLFFKGNRNCFFGELIHWLFGWFLTGLTCDAHF